MWEGSELGAGVTGLLYQDVQLYTPTRRAAQVILIQVRQEPHSHNALPRRLQMLGGPA